MASNSDDKECDEEVTNIIKSLSPIKHPKDETTTKSAKRMNLAAPLVDQASFLLGKTNKKAKPRNKMQRTAGDGQADEPEGASAAAESASPMDMGSRSRSNTPMDTRSDGSPVDMDQ